jgi:adenylate cyclase
MKVFVRWKVLEDGNEIIVERDNNGNEIYRKDTRTKEEFVRSKMRIVISCDDDKESLPLIDRLVGEIKARLNRKLE